MVYSYFPTRVSAEQWADDNLSLKVDQHYVIGLARDRQGDIYYVYYPLRARK